MVRGNEQYFELVFGRLSLDFRPKDSPVVLWVLDVVQARLAALERLQHQKAPNNRVHAAEMNADMPGRCARSSTCETYLLNWRFSACARSLVVAICQSIRFSGSCVRLHAIVPATVDAGGLGGLRSNNGFPGSDVLTHRLPWVFRGQSKTPKRSVTVNIQTISVSEKLAQAAGAFKTGLLNDYPPAESFASTAPHEVSATRSWGSAMRR